MPMKTFRGLLPDGGKDRIYLAGGDTTSGYRIAKFELMMYDPAGDEAEITIQVWKTSAAADAATKYIDFTQDALLAAGDIENNAAPYYPEDFTVIFDREVINQDIFITNNVGDAGSLGINYYIELEQVKMSDNETAVVNFNAALLVT